MMKQKMIFVGLVLCSMVFVTGSLSLFAVEIYVNQNNSKAADSNTGTKEDPFKTISAAAKIVKPGDRVTVAPGIYRESVTLTVSGEEGKPIIFRSDEPRKAIISGSDIITKWENIVWKTLCLP